MLPIPQADELHLLIVTGSFKPGPVEASFLAEPDWIDPEGLDDELALLKTALLYGDHTVIASPRLSAMWAISSVLASRNHQDHMSLAKAREVLEWVEAEDDLLMFNAGWMAGTAPTPQVAVPEDLELDWESYWKRIVQFFEHTAWPGMRRARDSGLVDWYGLGVQTQYGQHPMAVMGESLNLLAYLLAPESRYHPMLDEMVTEILAAATEVGVLRREPSETSRAREAAVANALIGRVPAVGSATVDELLDARERLAGALIPFRSAVLSFAHDVSAIPSNAQFFHEVDALYRETVAPALQDLNELADEQGWMALLKDRLSHSAGTVVKAVLGLAAADGAAFSELSQAAVGALVTMGDIGGGAYRRYRDLRRRQKENRILWLWRLERETGRAEQPRSRRSRKGRHA
jgi:hypothetical protein